MARPGKPWAPAELARLREALQTLTPRQLAQAGRFTGRGEASIRNAALRRGYRWPSAHWTVAELNRLREALSDGRTPRQIARAEFSG